MNRLFRALFACAVLIAAATASAHIVPPEEFHPAVEGYRSLGFILNLNPVSWDLVEQESGKIAASLDATDAQASERYRAAVRDLIEQVELEASISSPTPTMRKRTARGVFEVSTSALADLLTAHLNAAEVALKDPETSSAAFDIARQLWEAFAYEVGHADPEGARAVGRAWLEASSALGSAGLAGVGARPADTEVFGSAARAIKRYVNDNFGANFSASESGWMRPLPTASATYNPHAEIPAKLPPGSNMNKQLPRPRQLLNFAERGASESETALIALGDMFFDTPYIFGEPARSLQISCNTCHNKGVTNPKFFIPGLSTEAGGMDVSNSFFAPHANNAIFDPVDIPDLRGIKFTAPYGRNGRFASLREFTRNVIVNEFGGAEPTPLMLDAFIAYMNEFDFLANPNLGPAGMLSDAAPENAKRGEKLFFRSEPAMNHLSCADCHRPSSHFADGLKHDIGSVTGSSAYSSDGAMETPTLLSGAYTAPYFHDGSLPTLRSVTDWFNERFQLGYSERDAADLTAYLQAIGSGEEAYEDTMHTLESEMEEFSFFLSGYDYLVQRGDREAISTLFQTVETEIAAHKWDVQDRNQLPNLNDLQELMNLAYMANQAGDTKRVDELVDEYRATYDTHAEGLK